MKTIFDYVDYHEYLRELYLEKKQESSYFSYRFLGQKLELDPGFVAKVLQGRMHLAVASIPRVVAFFKFTKREADYFDAMVKFGRAKNERDVKIYFERMNALKGVESRILEQKQYQFYTRWHHTAIRALLGYYRFVDDYAALGAKLSPAIEADEARASIELLAELGLIARGQDGVWHLCETAISTGEAWRSEAIRAFQRETLALARESIDRHPKERRDVSTITMAISHADLVEIRERAKEFRQSVMQMKTGNEVQDCVYQVNIQVIPLTEIGAD